ncbi:MAG: hypothetical protein KKA81_09970 [Bacteroidetes bacterium]|nr:hypothetical protein [Bacteroidota bacterium]
MNLIKLFSQLIILATVIHGCSGNQEKVKSTEPETTNDTLNIALQEKAAAQPGPPVIVYKTNNDYSRNVPVILTMDKKNIASYPGPGDLKYKGEFAYPVELHNGYLLDRRGITDRVAFLDYSYEEYSKLEKTPTREELMNHILDKDPLTEMYFCGSRNTYRDVEKEVNQVLESGDLSRWSKLK